MPRFGIWFSGGMHLAHCSTGKAFRPHLLVRIHILWVRKAFFRADTSQDATRRQTIRRSMGGRLNAIIGGSGTRMQTEKPLPKHWVKPILASLISSRSDFRHHKRLAQS